MYTEFGATIVVVCTVPAISTIAPKSVEPLVPTKEATPVVVLIVNRSELSAMYSVFEPAESPMDRTSEKFRWVDPTIVDMPVAGLMFHKVPTVSIIYRPLLVDPKPK